MFANTSSIWSIASAMFRAGGALITLPIALKVIPEAEIGLYYTFLSLMAFALLLDIGLGQTLIRFSSQAWAGVRKFQKNGVPFPAENKKPNLSLLKNLMNAGFLGYLVVATVIVIVLIVPGGYFIQNQIDQADLSPTLIYCWIAMSIAIAYSFASEFWRMILFGIGGLKESHQVLIVAQLGSIIVTATALVMGLGLWSFPLARLVLGLVTRITAQFLLAKQIDAQVNALDADRKLLATMWPMSWRQGTVAIGEFLVMRSGVIICTLLYGLEVTARYGLTVQVMAVFAAICSAPLAVAVPQITHMRVHRNVNGIKILFFPRAYGGLLIMILLGILAAYFGNEFLSFTGSQTRFFEADLFILIVVFQALSFHQGSWMLLVLSENNNPFVFPIILTGVLVVILSWYFGTRFGIKGMITGQIVPPLLFMSWWSVMRGLTGLRENSQEPQSKLKHLRD